MLQESLELSTLESLCERSSLNISESVGKIKILSEFSNRLCKSRKYIRKPKIYSKAHVVTSKEGRNAIFRRLQDLKSQNFTGAAPTDPAVLPSPPDATRPRFCRKISKFYQTHHTKKFSASVQTDFIDGERD